MCTKSGDSFIVVLVPVAIIVTMGCDAAVVTSHVVRSGKTDEMVHDRAQITESLRRHGAAFAFVFGSRARGEATAGSDLDVGAWWHGRAPDPWSIALPAGVDLVVLNGAPLEVAGRIALEGDLLFDDDPPAQVRWTASTRKIWLDERPRFEAAHRLYLESAARG